MALTPMSAFKVTPMSAFKAGMKKVFNPKEVLA